MNLPKVLVDKVVKYGERLGINTTHAYILLLYNGLKHK